jgi:carboxypeptidase D
MVWIDQPIGTGFSPGSPNSYDELGVAKQFMGFWKNFINAFRMHGYKVYITGESYAGQYIPYITAGMLDKNDTSYYNVKGVQINDPLINSFNAMSEGVTSVHVFGLY